MQLHVMSFNLRTDTPMDKNNGWPYRVDYVADFIQQQAPDIIGTQEGLHHMLEQLDTRLPLYERVGEARGSQDADEHCAIFHRGERLVVQNQHTFWLSPKPDARGSIGWGANWPRICTYVTYVDPATDQAILHVYNVHLDHVSIPAQLHGIQLVWSIINERRQQDQLPFVITGDFNTEPSTEAITWLKQATVDIANNEQLYVKDAYDWMKEQQLTIGRTYHDYEGGEAGEPIDYIFVSSDIKIISATIHRDKRAGLYLSDHYPISAQLQL